MTSKVKSLKLVVAKQQEPGLPLAMAPQPEPNSALAPASKDQSNSPAAPILPHESEPDFRVLLDALTLELTGPRLGFSRQFAYEAAVSRANITRLRQALNASARSEFQPKGIFSRETMRGITDRRSIEELEAILKAPRPIRPPPLSHLERELEPLLDEEMRRFQEEVDLLYDLRFAEQRLSTMEQDLLDRCSAKKKGSAARSRARQGKTPQNSFIDDNNRLTKKARIVVGEAPLVAVESPLEYETNLREVMAFFGSRSVLDVLAAVDITNDTWQIRRLLQRREERVQAAFRAKMGEATGYRPEREDSIDPEVILAVVLHENHQMLSEFSRLIDRTRHRRKRTLVHAIKCNASKLSFQWFALSGMKLLK